jgi:hypothetical protein
MAKGNGKSKQDNIIAGFARDAKSSDENSAVNQAIRETIKQKEQWLKKHPENEERIRYVPGSPAHLAIIEENKAKRDATIKSKK